MKNEGMVSLITLYGSALWMVICPAIVITLIIKTIKDK